MKRTLSYSSLFGGGRRDIKGEEKEDSEGLLRRGRKKKRKYYHGIQKRTPW